jgi:hypothetical protein
LITVDVAQIAVEGINWVEENAVRPKEDKVNVDLVNSCPRR